MSFTARGRSIAILVLGAAHLWCACASNEETSPPNDAPDGSTDAGSGDATVDAKPPSDAAISCTESFCRVPLPISDVVALNGVWAKGVSDVWVVGSSGYVAHFDGQSWQRVPTGTAHAFFAVTASGDGTVWSASSGESFTMLNRAGDGGLETMDAGFKGIVTAISPAGASEAYAVGVAVNEYGFPATDNIWRYTGDGHGDGGAWTAVSPRCPTDEYMQPRCAKLRAVWAESKTRQWFAGDDGRIYRTASSTEDAGGGDRLQLTEVSSSSLRRLDALWGFGENDIWAVGSQGVIRHWDGGEAWSVVASPVTSDLHGVWGSRSDDVWAVGEDGVVLHWNGASWSQVEMPFAKENRPTLRAISGTGDDVWIAGDSVMLRSTSATGGDR